MSFWEPTTLSGWESLETFGTTLVIIGVAGEAIEIAAKLSETYLETAFKRWLDRRHDRILCQRCTRWKCPCIVIKHPLAFLVINPIGKLSHCLASAVKKWEFSSAFFGAFSWILVIFGLCVELRAG